MAALFGNSSDGRSEPRSLVEFRAGKMKLTGSTVTADTRKGLIYMKQDDRLMHFYWKDRNSGDVVDDLILFPGEVEFKRVAQCTTGRVYLLKFRDRPDRKYFYWMQEPKDSKDEELQKKVNDLINNPPDPSQPSLPEGLGSGLQALMGGHGQSLQSLLGALSPLPPEMLESISQYSSGGGGSSRGSNSTSSVAESSRRRTGATTTQQTPSRPPPQQQQQQQPQQPQQQTRPQLQLDDLQSILSSMNIPPISSQAAEPPEESIGLTEVVTPDILRPLSNDPVVQEQVESHLPPTSEQLGSVLTSPQFQQALGTFSGALQSGQLGPLMGQFGLGGQVVDAANAGSVDGFAEALQGELGEQGSTAATAQGGGEPEKKEEGNGEAETKTPPPPPPPPETQ